MNNISLNTLEAEQELITTVLTYPYTLTDIDELTPEHFSSAEYGLIYRTILQLRDEGTVYSPATIITLLRKRVDHVTLIAACDTRTALTIPSRIADLAGIVRNGAYKRAVFKAGRMLMDIASQDNNPDELTAEMEKIISQVTESGYSANRLTLFADYLPMFREKILERIAHKGELTGADTGFEELNIKTGGYQPGDLVIVGARPGMGKTAWMLHSALSVSRKSVGIIFSIEMGIQQLSERLVSSDSFVELYRLLHGLMSNDHVRLMDDTITRLEEPKLYIDDSSTVTIPYIRSVLRRLRRQIGPTMQLCVFVDYLQLVKGRGRNRVEEVSDVSRELKAIARELNCCVVALAQLNRETEGRERKRPVLSDLRDSGQIEQDADIVALLYREDYYDPESDERKPFEIIVQKHRNGERGTIRVMFTPETQRFSDLTRRE